MKFSYDTQIASQPEAVEAVLRKVVPRLDPSRQLLFCGQGTSLHAARVAAAWAGHPALAVESQDAALRTGVPPGAQVVVVSHSGAGFTPVVLRRARAAGATTFAVCSDAAPADADHVVRTSPPEKAQTHTVSYVTALAALGRMLGLDLSSAPPLLRDALAEPAPVDAARRLADKDPVLVAGFGLDAIAAEEAALKLKEATFRWAEGLSVEQALHGPQAALRQGMGAILFVPHDDDGGRTVRLRELCVAVGVEVFDIQVARCSEAVRPLVSIVPAQRLAGELARLTGGDPDRSRNPV
jgi:glutamine---fructose-6-phosphate transaminase (isomerizing)